MATLQTSPVSVLAGLKQLGARFLLLPLQLKIFPAL